MADPDTQAPTACESTLRIFPGSPEDFRRAIMASARLFRAGSILKIEGGERITTNVVLSGCVALSKSMESGARQIVDLALAGDIIDPFPDTLHASGVQIEALSDSALSVITHAEWRKLEERHPEVSRLKAAALSASMSRLGERMLRLGKASAEVRIAYALIEICIRLAAVGESWRGRYHVPMTQQDLGDFVGLSSVHVCRTLRRLARNGVISASDHTDIVIHDLDRLSAIADVEVRALRRRILAQY